MARLTRPLTNTEVIRAKAGYKELTLHEEHFVPLSAQALEILEVMKTISAHREHVFPRRNDPKQPMNSQTANAAVLWPMVQSR